MGAFTVGTPERLHPPHPNLVSSQHPSLGAVRACGFCFDACLGGVIAAAAEFAVLESVPRADVAAEPWATPADGPQHTCNQQS